MAASTPVHLELASVGDINFMKEIINLAMLNIDSLGLNEQELGSVYVALNGKKYAQTAFKDPKVRTVVDAIKHLFRRVERERSEVLHSGSTSGVVSRQISRVHFHCLQFHIVALSPNANTGASKSWRDPKRSVSMGSLQAVRQACDNNTINVDDVDLMVPLRLEKVSGASEAPPHDLVIDPASPVVSWVEDKIEFYLAPVLVCKTPLKTVGLGDAISAMGLISHLVS